MTTTRLWILGAVLGGALCIASQPPRATMAAGIALTVTPLTWNVVGLDSNNVAVGPNTYPVGARLCNTGLATLNNPVATFVWDSENSYIGLSGDPTDTPPVAALAPGACTDVYYTVAIVRSTAAYNTARRYHIAVTTDEGVSGSTPTPREIYVQGLNSQNRNTVTSISGPQSVTVGQTVQYVVTSKTSATYDQLTDFVDFPNTLFKVVSIAAAYGKPAGATNDMEYADACGWQPDPTLANYLSCVGPANPAYPTGVGSTIVTTYTLQVVAPGSITLMDAILDTSGNSYHYNADYGQGVNSSVPITVVPPPTATPTATAVPPTATPTATPTSTATDTAVPPTATATNTATNTATATATDTAVPPTATATSTAVPPTATATNTAVPPTATATSTATATPTDTAVPPTTTATDTATATATVTSTNTAVPPTATSTDTPTNTPTSTPVPPTTIPSSTPTDAPSGTSTTIPSSTPVELPTDTVTAPLILSATPVSMRATTTTPTPVATSTTLTPPVSPTHTSSHSTLAVAPTQTSVPTASTTPRPVVADPTTPPTSTPARQYESAGRHRPAPTMAVPPTVRSARPTTTLQPTATATPPLRPLPSLPDTGYGASAAARATKGSGALPGAVLLGLLALAGGWFGSLQRRSSRR